MASHRSLAPEQNEALRKQLRELVNARFEGNITRAAEALGVTHPTVSDVLNGKRGVGQKLLSAMAELSGKSIDAMLGRRVEYEPQPHREGDRLRQHPMWAEAVEELREKFARRGIRPDESVLIEVGDMSMSRLRPKLTADALRQFYEAVQQDREDNAGAQP